MGHKVAFGGAGKDVEDLGCEDTKGRGSLVRTIS